MGVSIASDKDWLYRYSCDRDLLKNKGRVEFFDVLKKKVKSGDLSRAREMYDLLLEGVDDELHQILNAIPLYSLAPKREHLLQDGGAWVLFFYMGSYHVAFAKRSQKYDLSRFVKELDNIYDDSIIDEKYKHLDELRMKRMKKRLRIEEERRRLGIEVSLNAFFDSVRSFPYEIRIVMPDKSSMLFLMPGEYAVVGDINSLLDGFKNWMEVPSEILSSIIGQDLLKQIG